MKNTVTTDLLNDVAASLTALDGQPWFVGTVRDWRAERLLNQNDPEECLDLRAGDPGKFTVYAGHQHLHSYQDTPVTIPNGNSIGVSAEKSPEQIAKDILQRLLPGYRVRIKQLVEAIADREAYEVRVECNRARLVAATGNREKVNGKGYREGIIDFGRFNVRGEATVYEKSVDLCLHSLTVDQAEAVLRLLYGEVQQ